LPDTSVASARHKSVRGPLLPLSCTLRNNGDSTGAHLPAGSTALRALDSGASTPRLSSKGRPTVTKAVTVATRPVVHPGALRGFVASSARRFFLTVIAYLCRLKSFGAECSHACAQVTSFSRPNRSGLRSPQGKPGVKIGGTKFETHAEDKRFQPAAELRLSIADLRRPPIVAGH
jgi:hypothetical protein